MDIVQVAELLCHVGLLVGTNLLTLQIIFGANYSRLAVQACT